ncbi:MAG: class I SAM-dependent methyltransferase [Acetobacteraceae bacterium]
MSPIDAPIDLSPVADIYAAMNTESVAGVPLSGIVGGGNPAEIAAQLLQRIDTHAGLRADDAVLDMGCGCGRIAAALTQRLSPLSRYLGIDIVPGLVEFAAKRIGSRFPNFRFLLSGASNQTYERFGAGSNGGDPEADPRAFDLAIALSLFTHLDQSVARKNLAMISRALRPNGRAFLTFFLLDAPTREIMRTGEPLFRFANQIDAAGAFCENGGDPMGAVAYETTLVLSMLADVGLYVDRIVYGGWPGRTSDGFQDAIVARPITTR